MTTRPEPSIDTLHDYCRAKDYEAAIQELLSLDDAEIPSVPWSTLNTLSEWCWAETKRIDTETDWSAMGTALSESAEAKALDRLNAMAAEVARAMRVHGG